MLVNTRAKVGVFSIALGAYLPQFPTLVPEFKNQYEAFKKMIPNTVDIVDGGIVTTKEASQKAGDLFRAADVFGIKASDTDVTSGEVNREGYKEVASELTKRFGFEKVAITLRESINANINNWSAMLYDGKDYYFSKRYNMQIVDRVGGGDSFGAGLIAASLEGYDPQATIEFAVAASCLKHSIEGDFNMVSMDEVLKLADGDGSGRVQR